MNKNNLVITSVLLITILVAGAMASNLPVSREASLIEATSPSEVMIQATGMAHWTKGESKKKDMDEYLLDNALEDAMKAAVYFVLYMGTDPLLNSDADKAAFEKIQQEFFALGSISKYIAWQGGINQVKRTKQEIRAKKEYKLKVTNEYKVNKQLITEELVRLNVLQAREDITKLLGLPVVMVIPAVEKGKNPIDVLQKNANLSHAAKVIEGFLTARQYSVQVPENAASLNELTSAQISIAGIEDDYSYKLALSIGSDVCITYEVNLEKAKFDTKKAVVSVRAYETTTSRLLGTETGYSPTAQSPDLVLIENAINDAIDKVLSRILEYWKSDLGLGIQYKLIVSIASEFSEGEAEDISFAFADILESISANRQFKENIITKQTLDYLVWANPKEYSRSTNFYRDIKKQFRDEFPDGELNQININRKLVLLKVTPN
ncbi:hypothetical protein K8I28_03070 [bacterium]|nr:hypothetical protein [bacterium]